MEGRVDTMGGGVLLQLHAKTELNQFLSGNPQHSFFRVTHRRHAHFAIEHSEVLPKTGATWGGVVEFDIPRTGDLWTDVVLQVEVPAVEVADSQDRICWPRAMGYALIESCELYLGGTRLERIDGEWMYLANMLREPERRFEILRVMAGEDGTELLPRTLLPERFLMIPLRFFFTRSFAHGLPLVALSCEQLTLRLQFRSFEQVVRHMRPDLPLPRVAPLRQVSLLNEMIYLETPERERLCQDRLVHLVEAVEFQRYTGLPRKGSLDLTEFHGCLKELVIVFQRKEAAGSTPHIDTTGAFQLPNYNDFGNFTSHADPKRGRNMVARIGLQLNGAFYFPALHPQYYNAYLPLRFHKGQPATGVYVMPFCLHPEDTEPSGTLNIDRIDQARIYFEGIEKYFEGCEAHVYGIRYNVLEVQGRIGQARLLFD